jgi:hypothetical protein
MEYVTSGKEKKNTEKKGRENNIEEGERKL